MEPASDVQELLYESLPEGGEPTGDNSEYQSLVDDGVSARLDGDHTQFELGRLALKLPEGRTIEEYAKDIHVGRSTLYGYKQMAEFYSAELEDRFLSEESPLSYTHMRNAMWGKELDEAVSLLEQWWAELVTVDQSDLLTYGEDKSGRSNDGGNSPSASWRKLLDGETTTQQAAAQLARMIAEAKIGPKEKLKISIYSYITKK